MNEPIEQIQLEYREKRVLSNYSIFDIEISLKDLAKKGNLWPLTLMEDMAEAECILVDYYLNMYREIQNFDFL